MNHVLSRRLGVLAFAGVMLSGVACADDPTSPTVAQVAGDYIATRFTATSVLGTQDLLGAGGSVTAQFATTGAVTGHIAIPSESVNEDFAGTWKIDGSEVEIEQVPNDTFLEDVRFNVAGNTLVADDIFDGVRVRLTLTKR